MGCSRGPCWRLQTDGASFRILQTSPILPLWQFVVAKTHILNLETRQVSNDVEQKVVRAPPGWERDGWFELKISAIVEETNFLNDLDAPFITDVNTNHQALTRGILFQSSNPDQSESQSDWNNCFIADTVVVHTLAVNKEHHHFDRIYKCGYKKIT